ncbi:MAG TPA: tripartite tricarboxylate transporter substrate binding protein [Burkholderiales bacterium]|nr:tripartite tricarboxylate transporter substrate binding protein [Burkholderiales bacterium]
MKLALAAVVAFACAVPLSEAWSQAYPTRPIRLIAPFPPGGGTDLLARIIAVPVGEALGQTVVVDNRPGAGGALGAELGAHAERDGHTLVLVSASYAATGAYQKLTFDPINDIQPVILIGTTGLALAVHPSVPVKHTADLVALAKTRPGKLNYASVGPGSAVHLAFELFKLMSKTNFVHVPYKGGGPALNALMAGEVQASMTSMVPTIPHARAGKVRLLAITPAKRSPALPDTPTVAETIPGFDVTHWYGIWGPKGIRREIVLRWNKEVAKVLATEEIKARTRGEGLELAGGPPAEFGAVVRRDVEKWRRVIREAKIARH